jgi:hypothetical protein
MLTGRKYLSGFAVLSDDDPRERIRQSGRIGSDQGSGLVHVSADLEELKRKQRKMSTQAAWQCGHRVCLENRRSWVHGRGV